MYTMYVVSESPWTDVNLVVNLFSKPRILFVLPHIQTRTGEHVLIMENCEGGSLYSKLREPEYYFGLPEEDLLRLIIQISELVFGWRVLALGLLVIGLISRNTWFVCSVKMGVIVVMEADFNQLF